MIKEIEVGGVKHSITLADDMIGSGLTRGANNKITINFGTGLTISSENNLEVDTADIVGTGLLSTGGKISLSLPNIVANGGGLITSGGGLSVSGVEVSKMLSGSGLIAIGDVLQANVNTSSGLNIDENKIQVKIAERSSGLRLFFNSNGEIDVTQN